MKYKHIFLTLLFLFVVSMPALSQEGQMREMEKPMMGMAKRLNLSDEQKSKIGKLRTEFQKQQITQRSKLQLVRIEIRELMQAEKSDKSAIEKKIREASELQAQQHIARANQLLAIRNILTPEQQKVAREGMLNHFRQGLQQHRMKMRRQPGGEFRGPRMRGKMMHRRGLGENQFFDEDSMHENFDFGHGAGEEEHNDK